MQRNLITALLIAAAVMLWLLSGVLFESGPDSPRQPLASEGSGAAAADIPAVRIRLLEAQSRDRVMLLRGRTQSKRQVEVKAQVAGAVVNRPVERGQFVSEGDMLCELAVDDRRAAVAQAQAQLKQAEIEFRGTQKLQVQGLQSETATAAAKARLETARASLERENIALQKTRVKAPFAGFIDRLHMHVGDYASVGSTCVTLVELDPMLVVATISEHEVQNLKVGAKVSGTAASGQDLHGEVTFVASQSDPATRTYAVEVTVPNPDHALKSGLTTRLQVQLNTVIAHLVSPALFTLNDAGEVGVRVVDDKDVVKFYPINLVEDSAQGAWVTGLPEQVRIITVGHEFVIAGQTVRPVVQEASVLGGLVAPES